MLTLESSKTFKVLIIASALLIAFLVQTGLAKPQRNSSKQQKQTSQRKQANKAPAKTKAPKISNRSQTPARESTRDNSSRQRPSTGPQILTKPNIIQRQTVSTGLRKTDIPNLQVRAKPSPNVQIASPPRQSGVPQPSRERGQNNIAQRITTAPDRLELNRPTPLKPDSAPQIIKPQINIISKPRLDIGSEISTRIGRQLNLRAESKPLFRKKPQQESTGRIVTRNESQQSISKPIRQTQRDTQTNSNSGRANRIAVPRAKPAPAERIAIPRKKPTPAERITIPREKPASPAHEQTDVPGHAEQSGRGNGRTDRNRSDGISKPNRNVNIHRTNFVRSHRRTHEIGKGNHDFRRFRPAATRKIIYEDRTRRRDRQFHHDFVFRDLHRRISHRIIWPRYSFRVFYRWGHHYSFHYAYPFYQHRYVFVSLGGFWPDYTCLRYYWYPAHSFWWYGYYPVAQQVQGDTYNYYTYNYYGQQAAAGVDYGTGISPVDSNTFADVREKLSRQQQDPDTQTPADALFDEGIKAFEQGLYTEAAGKFAAAMELAPDDVILPFSYAQALFADARYTQAAEALRQALQNSSPDKPGVYYPRGLYLDENTLDEQIDRLAEQTENRPYDSDLQLLLGYQLLGIGETEKSIEPLKKAKEDYKNFGAAATLLELAEQIASGESE